MKILDGITEEKISKLKSIIIEVLKDMFAQRPLPSPAPTEADLLKLADFIVSKPTIQAVLLEKNEERRKEFINLTERLRQFFENWHIYVKK